MTIDDELTEMTARDEHVDFGNPWQIADHKARPSMATFIDVLNLNKKKVMRVKGLPFKRFYR